MDRTDHPGTGNSYVQVPWREMLRLQNEPITAEQIRLFLQWQQLPIRVELHNNPKIRQWGTAWHNRKLVRLYRHSVWTFLHEIAHVVAGHHGHSEDFPVALRGLYLKWKELES